MSISKYCGKQYKKYPHSSQQHSYRGCFPFPKHSSPCLLGVKGVPVGSIIFFLRILFTSQLKKHTPKGVPKKCFPRFRYHTTPTNHLFCNRRRENTFYQGIISITDIDNQRILKCSVVCYYSTTAKQKCKDSNKKSMQNLYFCIPFCFIKLPFSYRFQL